MTKTPSSSSFDIPFSSLQLLQFTVYKNKHYHSIKKYINFILPKSSLQEKIILQMLILQFLNPPFARETGHEPSHTLASYPMSEGEQKHTSTIMSEIHLVFFVFLSMSMYKSIATSVHQSPIDEWCYH